MSRYLQKYPWLGWVVLVVVVSTISITISFVLAQSGTANDDNDGLNTTPVPSDGTAELNPVEIRPGPATPQVDTGIKNAHGTPVMASCTSCHATTEPNRDTNSSHQLSEFHQGLTYNHGDLTCLSCHNANDYDSLRMANGNSVAFPDVMTLCGQCHGPQKRDYDHGTHGGMNGYWDLTKGARVRNNCTHCHDPHSPAFPLVMPVLPPRDRISVGGSHSEGH